MKRNKKKSKTIVLFAKSNNYELYLSLGNISVYNRNCNNVFSYIKHKKSVSAVKYGTYLIFSILMICLGITTILFKRYDSICAISIGITFLNITYKDRRNFPPSFTINYIDYLKGYVVGFVSIMYGLFRIFK